MKEAVIDFAGAILLAIVFYGILQLAPVVFGN